MRNTYNLLILLTFCFFSCREDTTNGVFDSIEESYQINEDRDKPFDKGWKFTRKEIQNGYQPDIDDSNWREVTLPHDWSIEDLQNQQSDSVIGPFTKDSPGGASTGHVSGGVGWYRKAFRLDPNDENKEVIIRFDGVYMDSEVWVNGEYYGKYPNGYMPFYYNITSSLNETGQTNVIAVKVNNIGENSRWYTGSGIYRHVWLSVLDPIHFETFGINVITNNIAREQAEITIESSIESPDTEEMVEVTTNIYDTSGKIVSSKNTEVKLLKEKVTKITQELSIDKPDLWYPESPDLYMAEISIVSEGEVIDKYAQSFGIRTISFNAEDGFLLNGKSYLIKGGCLHHDNGPLGAATLDRAEYRRVELMKEYGFNGIRTAHNPPSPQFLDACDKMGMLVIDEAFDMWEVPKKPQDYSNHFKDWWDKDLKSFIKRDRNHPSVIVWSIGNEIYERTDSAGLEWTKLLYNAVKEEDTTRPVTEALCEFWQRKGKPWEDNYPGYQLLDVGGYNYQWDRYRKDHKDMPELVMIGTESFAKEAYESWKAVEELPYVIGDFVWTGMDYFGESGIGSALYTPPAPPLDWPWFNGFCGDIDICGNKKPQSHYRDVVWDISKIEMAVHQPIPEEKEEYVTKWGWPDERQSWTWDGYEGESMSVNVYTKLPIVQIMLNGELLDEVINDSTLIKSFNVPYQPGTLTAVGIEDGEVVDSVSLSTAGKPSKISLRSDRDQISSNFNDLSFISVIVTDEEGRRIPDYHEMLSFEVSGIGELVAVANGNPTDMKSFTSPECKSYKGRSLIIVRSNGDTGEVIVKASGKGLEASQVVIPVL